MRHCHPCRSSTPCTRTCCSGSSEEYNSAPKPLSLFKHFLKPRTGYSTSIRRRLASTPPSRPARKLVQPPKLLTRPAVIDLWGKLAQTTYCQRAAHVKIAAIAPTGALQCSHGLHMAMSCSNRLQQVHGQTATAADACIHFQRACNQGRGSLTPKAVRPPTTALRALGRLPPQTTACEGSTGLGGCCVSGPAPAWQTRLSCAQAQRVRQ